MQTIRGMAREVQGGTHQAENCPTSASRGQVLYLWGTIPLKGSRGCGQGLIDAPFCHRVDWQLQRESRMAIGEGRKQRASEFLRIPQSLAERPDLPRLKVRRRRQSSEAKNCATFFTAARSPFEALAK